MSFDKINRLSDRHFWFGGYDKAEPPALLPLRLAGARGGSRFGGADIRLTGKAAESRFCVRRAQGVTWGGQY